MIQYYFRFENAPEDIVSSEFGPYPEYVQLTHEDLRIGPDGAIVAQIVGGMWYSCDNPNMAWTDVVIWAKESAA
jgi:hypothetical protein